MTNYQPLKGITSVFDYTLNNLIQDGLVEYFDWALLEKGNYFNINSGEMAPNGENYSTLRLASNNHYNTGQVWEGFKSNWVWQSGVSHTPAPIVGTNTSYPGISGVYVDGAYKPIDITGTYAHHVDYYHGRVIFDTALPTGSVVQSEFSYKWINVTYANSLPWLREIQRKTLQPGSTFSDISSGDWDVPPEARLQLPAIAIEVVPKRTQRGYQLGGGQWVFTDVLFHCIAEDETTRNALVDIVSFQNDKNIHLFNADSINAASGFPLDYRGVPVSDALRYPDLVDTYSAGLLRFTKSMVQEMTIFDSDIYGGIVRMTTEGIKANI